MAGSVNKAILVGRLGKDPEMKYTTSGQGMAKFSIATSESYTDKSGQKQEKTTWHNIIVWGKLAEICGKYLKKGSQAYFEGRIENRSYEADGQTKYISEVVVNNMTMLGGRGDTDGGSYTPSSQNSAPASNSSDSPALESDTDLPF